MALLFSNNSSAKLATALTADTTTLYVEEGKGSYFPVISTEGDYFYVTLVGDSVMEIVKVTATEGDTFTIVRAQDNTEAAAFAIGDLIELRITAAAFKDINTSFSTLDNKINVDITNSINTLDTKLSNDITTLSNNTNTSINTINTDISNLNTTLTNNINSVSTAATTGINEAKAAAAEKLPLAGGTMTGAMLWPRGSAYGEDGIYGGMTINGNRAEPWNGATFVARAPDAQDPNAAVMVARDTNGNYHDVVLRPNGDFQKDGNLVLTGNGVVTGKVSGNSFTLPSGGTWKYMTFTHNDVYVYSPYGGSAAGGTKITREGGYPQNIIYIAVRVS